jgi:hypothetical protein
MCIGPSKKTQPIYDRQVEKEKEKIRSVRPDATDEQVEGGAKRLAIQNVFLDPDARKPISTPAPTPAPTPVATPTPSEPEPKMRVINRTVKAGTRRSGTSSLRIARNPNTGSGNLNY